ncbi:hypothetical protein BU16DRAFT_330171 [Lophium mytilinum]|uniref:F-box domain-containing protein n=1 Tax=Lophium mytilinum TaxID=390894 RepID=A0A6A6R274_9PEZI|nr:hypothetical protein BU16DRAFT_330171 [Lophium mytilinum]
MPPFLALPPELLLDIADYLPPDAILALKLTHPTLNTLLPPPLQKRTHPLPRCARLAYLTYLRRPSPTSLIRCILCKATYPAALFTSAASPACLTAPSSAFRNEVVELPPRFCAWHVSRLARVVRVAPGEGNGWTSRVERMCMHCGAVQAWRKCGCGCGSCGVRGVRTYTRWLDNGRECRGFLFWREQGAEDGGGGGGRLFVRETCWSSGRWKLGIGFARIWGLDGR